MRKSYFQSSYALFFFFVFIVLFSCKNGDADKKTADQSPAESIVPSHGQTEKPVAVTISGKLDTLWVDSLSFAQLPNSKMVFSFTFRQNDTLTLHGWVARGAICAYSYDSVPDIKLLKGKPSGLNLTPDIYLGNVTLQKDDIKKIKDALKTAKAQYVLFAPQMIGEHIGYNIYVGNDNPALLVRTFAITDTGTDANPSPPKIY